MTSIDADYAQAGFAGALTFGERPALLLVDMCRAYVDPDCALYAGPSAQAALDKAVALRAAAHAAGAPVVFTRVEYRPDGRDGGVFFQKVPALKNFVSGNPMADFLPELTPAAGDVVLTKQYPSAFFATPLASMLTAWDVDTVVVTGYSTSGCVRASTLDALQYGFRPFVAADACADRKDGPHTANLFDLQAKYAEVTATEDLIARFKAL